MTHLKVMMWVAVALSLAAALLLVNHWRNQSNLYEAAKNEVAECHSSITKTKELNDALEAKRETVAKQLTAYKLRHPNTCLQLPNSQSVGTKPASGNGTITGTTDDFRDYAAQCANYWNERQQLEQSLIQCKAN